jgi:hypothetical protein
MPVAWHRPKHVSCVTSFTINIGLTANSCKQTNKRTKPIQNTLCISSKCVAPWRCTLQSKHVEGLRLIVHLAGDKIVCVRKMQREGIIVSELCIRASKRCCAWDVEVLVKQAARRTFRNCWSVWFRKLGLSVKFGGCWPVWFRKLGLSGKFGGHCSF